MRRGVTVDPFWRFPIGSTDAFDSAVECARHFRSEDRGSKGEFQELRNQSGDPEKGPTDPNNPLGAQK